jgi:hypothetical protein
MEVHGIYGFVIRNMDTNETALWTPPKSFIPDTIIPKNGRIERKIAIMYERFERRHK